MLLKKMIYDDLWFATIINEILSQSVKPINIDVVDVAWQFINKDNNWSLYNLFKQFKKKRKTFEIVRMPVDLNSEPLFRRRIALSCGY